MLRYLLDTDICIYTIKNRPVSVREAFKRHQGHMAISSITLMELLYGAEKSSMPEQNLGVVESFVARLDVLDYDRNAAAHTAQIRAELAKSGTPIGPYDQMIAGQARSRGLVIVTHNTREFQRVAGTRVEDWLAIGSTTATG